jgi:hypothetical protein
MATLTTPSFVSTIGVGGATPAASGAGITFPATQSASSDANTLDDYEEGTWTPTISSDGTLPTVTSYANRSGVYTKVGNIVTCTCTVRASISSAGTGTPRISGLPFGSSGNLEGVAMGITDLFTPASTAQWVDSSVVNFITTWRTGINNYVTFTVTYRVA